MSTVDFPHTVAELSWRRWDPSAWERQCLYRRHFESRTDHLRHFPRFDGALTNTAGTLNGQDCPPHQGGYLPFRYEITDQLSREVSDATRALIRAVDTFGNDRPYVSGDVTFALDSPAVLVGSNPFPLEKTGGVGAVWLRSGRDKGGAARLVARHPALGSATAELVQVAPLPRLDTTVPRRRPVAGGGGYATRA